MSFTTPNITYEAYAYKNGNYPIEIINETIDLVNSPNGEFIAPKGKIIVKVNYASLNPIDTKLYELKPSFMKYINGKQGFGKDFSGKVISIGDETNTDVKVGEYIQGMLGPLISSKGTVAQYVLLDPKVSPITTVPTNINLAQASSWPLVLGTAIGMLKGLQIKDSKIAVLGASTSVGRYVVQLARIGGAKEIVTTNSTRNKDLITKLGATSQIDYTRYPNFLKKFLDSVKESGEFDYIIDTYGGNQLFPEINHILKKGGVYNTIVGDSTGHGLDLIYGTMKTVGRVIYSKLGLLGYEYNFAALNMMGGWINDARDMIQDEKLQIFVDSIYPFDQLDKGVERLDSGKANGKVVIEVSKE
ncbi:YIM1 [Candida jiufengensis]|uniref:YIM1 n=1 Tax=Candida jiufengensis TaxID=497108 RepID=UPI00222520F7|nr:YIM1 [Candida jiufengensis]KAI5951530.1 YIM1 [Candida jiufengensis]